MTQTPPDTSRRPTPATGVPERDAQTWTGAKSALVGPGTSRPKKPKAKQSAPTAGPEGAGPGSTKRPLWVRWTALVLFVAVLGTVFVNMGDWQLRRLAQRKASNQVILTNIARPVAPFDSVFTAPIGKAMEWRPVEVTGTFDADHQYVVRYRSNDGATGYEVVTPLHATNGKTVLIDRGFVEVEKGTAIATSAPAPPSGQVSIVGRVRRSEAGRLNAITPVDGQMRLINAYAIATTLPYPVVDGYLDVLSMTPAQTGDFQVKALPEISDGPHFWYAVQWFMFTGIGLAGIVVFIRGDLRERKAAKAEAAAGPE